MINNDLLKEIEDKIPNIKEKKKPKKNKETKPLYFPIKQEDAFITKNIKTIINNRKITSDEIVQYFEDRDPENTRVGRSKGYNIINGLKNRASMNETTLELWCEFLGLTIHLK